MNYPKFEVSGVSPSETWQLFNISNYQYYKRKVADLIAGVCPFCCVDPVINKMLLENESWMVWENKVAPKSGQRHQFVIPLKRHVDNIHVLTRMEWIDLGNILWVIENQFSLTGGVVVIRSGDPSLNAKSVPHLHVNYHVPIGDCRVEVTIAKSYSDLVTKLGVLSIFEKMRLMEISGVDCPYSLLSEAEASLVVNRLLPTE